MDSYGIKAILYQFKEEKISIEEAVAFINEKIEYQKALSYEQGGTSESERKWY